jgi:SET domain
MTNIFETPRARRSNSEESSDCVLPKMSTTEDPPPKEPYKLPFDLLNAQFPRELCIEQGENYSSKTLSNLKFAKGQVICSITQATYLTKPTWTTVQVSAERHIELNSELVYLNHSCDPSVRIDVENLQVVALKDLNDGDELTFFYPSTEFDMSQGFKCWYRSKS